MNTPFFSVGIPVYNAEKYLNDCIDSILSQSFTDFELILVDDGSIDNSLSICQSYAEKDSRVKVFHYENGGISVASNHILENVCGGGYIFLMDNDDTMCPDALQNAYNAIIENNYPDIVRANHIQVENGIRGSVQALSKPSDEWYTLTKDEKLMDMLIKGILLFPLWTKFIKVSLIKDNSITFNEKYSGAQDADFTIKIFRKADKVMFADFAVVNWYHPREGSVSSKYNLQHALCNLSYLYDYIQDFDNWDMSDYYIKEGKIAFYKRIRMYAGVGFSMKYEDAVVYAEAVEQLAGEELKKLPKLKIASGKLYRICNILGFRRGILLINRYFRFRGFIE